MLNENDAIDGTWELTIEIPDIKENVKVRVRGDIHVGGVMHRAVEKLQQKQDWSDHMLWWPQKNIWLSHTRTTLDQYGVQSNSNLHLIKVHNNLTILLPSLSQATIPVNYSADLFSVIIRICRELSIRFPEELSLQLQLTKESLKSNHSLSMIKNKNLNTIPEKKEKNHGKEIPTPEPLTPHNNNTMRFNTFGGYGGHGTALSPTGTLRSSMSSQLPLQSCNSLSYDGAELFKFSECMKLSAKSVFDSFLLVQPKNITQKARLNCTWLDSSRSLMEQGIPPDFSKPLYLRFKFSLFYDLNIKYDNVRIHQLYEQAKWDLISSRLDVTEDEMVLFAALQMQAEIRTDFSTVEDNNEINNDVVDSKNQSAADEIELMLSELEEMYLGNSDCRVDGNIIQEPRLEGSLRVFRVNKLGIKSQKRLWCVLQKQSLLMYPSKDEASQILMNINIGSSYIKPEVNVSSHKYFVKITTGNKEEIRLNFDNNEEYANWMAAIRLVARKKTLTNKVLFQKELDGILDVLRLQTPGPTPGLDKEQLSVKLKELNNYMPDKIIKKAKSKDHLRNRIGESHANVRQLTLLEAKLKYIHSWQRLENFGITYILVHFDHSTKDEIIGIASTKVMLLNSSNGDVMHTYYYNELRSWNINWDAEKVILDFKSKNLEFKPLSSNCKTVVEFIGGYVFLNQRNPDKSQDLNVKLFHKLTGSLS